MAEYCGDDITRVIVTTYISERSLQSPPLPPPTRRFPTIAVLSPQSRARKPFTTSNVARSLHDPSHSRHT